MEKQRAAIGRFLISFYVRRSLTFVRESLPSLPRPLKAGNESEQPSAATASADDKD